MGGNKLEQIIIRNALVKCVSSSLTYEMRDEETQGDTVRRLGKEGLLTKIFKEDKRTYNDLFEEYQAFQNGTPSDSFLHMYLLSPRVGVVLGAHITLYRFDFEVYTLYKDLVPWGYAEGCKYLGDTWWEKDEEILFNLQHMSVVEFLEQYKGL